MKVLERQLKIVDKVQSILLPGLLIFLKSCDKNSWCLGIMVKSQQLIKILEYQGFFSYLPVLWVGDQERFF